MSNFYMEGFHFADRPQLLHRPEVTDLPASLESPERQLLEATLKFTIRDGSRCAFAALRLESLLEKHEIPFLLIRVADVHMILDNKLVALELYAKANVTLAEMEFGAWIDRTRDSVVRVLSDQATRYRIAIPFTPSQRWTLRTSEDPFPYCKMQSTQLKDMHESWHNIAEAETAHSKFLNQICIDTNEIEGVVTLDMISGVKLVDSGFFGDRKLDSDSIVRGEIQDAETAMELYRDTRKAMDFIFEFNSEFHEGRELTVKGILHIHATLMHSTRILHRESPGGVSVPFKYINAGRTRTATMTDVAIINGQMKVQFCPCGDVDEELEIFCRRFNELMRMEKMDPFAAAAWISHIFVAIHPFEDGNGRVSRILASIPLVKAALPPVCISPDMKSRYISALNEVRANRDGDYTPLMNALFLGTEYRWRILQQTIKILKDDRNRAMYNM